MDNLIALVSGTYGVVLFGLAIYRAIRFKVRPLEYAMNFIHAISILALALGVFGVMPFDRGLSINVTLNLVSTFMLAAEHDRKNPEGRISRSH